MIGVVRRILDGLPLKSSSTRLTHEVLTTLMAEVMAVMNAIGSCLNQPSDS